MAEKIVIDGKKINSIFRRSELKYVLLFAFLFSLIAAGLINFLVIIIDSVYMVGSSITYPVAYMASISDDFIFNFVVMSFLFIFLSLIYSYYIFIESKIHFKSRKYYLTINNNFLNIFSFPFAIIFSFIMGLFAFFSMLNIIKQMNPTFDPLLYAAFLISILILIIFIFYWYFRLGIKTFVFTMLNLYNNISSNLKRNLNDTIYSSRLNLTPLWLIILKITNFNDLAYEIKRSKKFLMKIIIQELKKTVRTIDYIIPADDKKGIISFVIDNEEKTIMPFINDKIVPFLENDINYKNIKIKVKVSFTIQDLQQNEEISCMQDIILESKK